MPPLQLGWLLQADVITAHDFQQYILEECRDRTGGAQLQVWLVGALQVGDLILGRRH